MSRHLGRDLCEMKKWINLVAMRGDISGWGTHAEALFALACLPCDHLLIIYFHLVCDKSLQSCSTLCDPMDCSPPGSSVHGILQARILEWVAMPSSRGVFPTQGLSSCLLCLLHCRQIIYHWATREDLCILHYKFKKCKKCAGCW